MSKEQTDRKSKNLSIKNARKALAFGAVVIAAAYGVRAFLMAVRGSDEAFADGITVFLVVFLIASIFDN